jgi:hypothetical protein
VIGTGALDGALSLTVSVAIVAGALALLALATAAWQLGRPAQGLLRRGEVGRRPVRGSDDRRSSFTPG